MLLDGKCGRNSTKYERKGCLQVLITYGDFELGHARRDGWPSQFKNLGWVRVRSRLTLGQAIWLT